MWWWCLNLTETFGPTLLHLICLSKCGTAGCCSGPTWLWIPAPGSRNWWQLYTRKLAKKDQMKYYLNESNFSYYLKWKQFFITYFQCLLNGREQTVNPSCLVEVLNKVLFWQGYMAIVVWVLVQRMPFSTSTTFWPIWLWRGIMVDSNDLSSQAQTKVT
jgi:hypothetical protein